MLATPGGLPEGPEWLFEVKWDGMRLLADVADGAVRLSSRTERDVTPNFPELPGCARLAPDVLLDGEVVLLEGGVPSFAALADRMHDPVDPRTAAARPVTYMVFDVLRLYGVSLAGPPARRAAGHTGATGPGRRCRTSRCRPATPTGPRCGGHPAARDGGGRGQAPGQPLPAGPAQPAAG